VTPVGSNAVNVCTGGGDTSQTAYTCADNQPFVQNGVLMMFAASNTPCCQCFELDFSASGYNFGAVIQVTNDGGDLGQEHFDLQFPGGGFGIYDGCDAQSTNGPAQYGSTAGAWGQQYGGVSSASACSGLPQALRAGCNLRFSAFQGADNPQAKYRRVQCPSALTAISGCVLSDDASQPTAAILANSNSNSNLRQDAPATLANAVKSETTMRTLSLIVGSLVMLVILA